MLRLIIPLVSIVYHVFQGRLQLGTPYHQPPPPSPQGQAASTLAIITLVCGIGTWTLLPGIAAPVGLITGFIELGNIKKGASPAAGMTFTKVGLVLCAAQIILSIIGGCLFIAFYMGVFALFFGAAATGG